MRKRFAEGFIVSFLLVLSLFFTSCSHINVQTEDYFKKPSNVQQTERILNSVYEFCGEDAELVYALSGQNINPIVFNDINGDGNNEVIVLYRNSSTHPDNDDKVNIMILTDDGETVSSLFDIEGLGYDIDKYLISDMNNDGCSELIVGYQIVENSKVIFVYSFNFEKMTFMPCVNTQYTDFVMTDIDSDGKNDIVLVYYNHVRNETYANVIKCLKNGSIYLSSIADTPMSVSGGMYKMTVSEDSSGKSAVLVSSKQKTYLSSIEVLTWNERFGIIINESYAQDNVLPNTNVDINYCSFGRLIPTDINEDGYIEIPICYRFDEMNLQYELNQGKETSKYLYGWYRYDSGNGLVKVLDSYISEANNYVFIIKDNWSFSKVKAYETYKKDLLFYYVSDYDFYSEEKLLLFTIKTSASKVKASDTVIPLVKSNGFYYYIELNPDVPEELKNNILPSAEELKDSFILTMLVAEN